MNKESLKEETNKYLVSNPNYSEICPIYGVGDKALMAMAFQKGAVVGERIGKISLLKYLRVICDEFRFTDNVAIRMQYLLSELEEEVNNA